MAFTAAPLGVAASETDQFITWGVEIADSAEPLNEFVHQEFEIALARLERQGRVPPCEKTPGRLYRRVFSSIYWSRLRRFVQQQPEVEGYPRRGVGYWQYRSQSVFRKPVFPGSTLRIHVKKLRHRRNVWKFRAEAMVEDTVVAQATYSAMIMDD